MPQIALIGTLDTKGAECAFLAEHIQRLGCQTILIDAGVLGEPAVPAAVTRHEVARAAGESLAALRKAGDRGAAVTAMARGAAAVVRRLYEAGQIDGVLAVGGSAGTTIGTAAMRQLPLGVPKLMVSTLASGDTRPFVGVKDIAMLYSVVDIAGLNRISGCVLANAASAIVGQVTAEVPRLPAERTLVAATMFGVTTPCVEYARSALPEERFELVVFHATGMGGRAMESLIAEGYFAGVLDITTTEWADQVVGGVLSAGPRRLEAAAKAGVPQVVSVGACDMVNFGPPETVPARFAGRTLYRHNENVTLMRTTPEECRLIGRAIGERVAASTGPAAVLLPLKGLSAIDRPGEVFYDPASDAALFSALRAALAGRPDIAVLEEDLYINDPAFGRKAAELLCELMEQAE